MKGKPIVTLVVVLVLACMITGCGISNQEYAEKLLVIDKDVISALDCWDNALNAVSEANTESPSNPSFVQDTIQAANNLLDATISLKESLNKTKSEIEALEAPQGMEDKKDTYLRYLDNTIAASEEVKEGVSIYLAGAQSNNSEKINQGAKKMLDACTKIGSYRTNLAEIRDELGTIKDGAE